MKQKDMIYLGVILAAGLGIYWWQKSKEAAPTTGFPTAANQPLPKSTGTPMMAPGPTASNTVPAPTASFVNTMRTNSYAMPAPVPLPPN